MVLVKDLARLLNGVNANFDVESVSGIDVDFDKKRVRFIQTSIFTEVEPWDGESERFFPNIAGIDDDMDLGTNTTPRIDLSNPDKQSKDRFTPNDAGWTDENEYYYQKFKKGGNDLTYLEELEEIGRIKKGSKHEHLGVRDFGSNTVQP